MKKYQLRKGFITQKIGDKINIFDGEESFLYTFNKTAAFIFERLKQGMADTEIIEALIKKYNIKKDRAEQDLKEFTVELKRRKIITD